jgi:adenine-specific DNA-methyltransferase
MLVQLPQPTGQREYPTIADICKERVRRVIKEIEGRTATELDLEDITAPDLGFRLFKLSESNFKTWDADKSDNAQQLEHQSG